MTFPFRPEPIDELIKDYLFFWTTDAHPSKKKRDTIFLFQAQLKLHCSQGF
jgi:hypothetical protein